jgi:hypothetical protein
MRRRCLTSFAESSAAVALARAEATIVIFDGTLMATTVMDHIAQQGEIAPQVKDRITRLN